MGRTILARDPDTLIAMWKLQGTPFFAVIQGKNEMIFKHDEDDNSAAEDRLRQCLEYILDSQTTGEFVLRSYNDGENISNKKEYFGSIPFKFTEYEPLSRTGKDPGVFVLNGGGGHRQHPVPAADPAVLELLQGMKAILEQQAARIEALEAAEEEEEEQEEEIDEEAEFQRKMERYVAIGSLIAGQIAPIFERFFPTKTGVSNIPEQQISGVMNDDQILAKAVKQMTDCIGQEKFVQAMARLGQMAETQPDVFKNLLNMLGNG